MFEWIPAIISGAKAIFSGGSKPKPPAVPPPPTVPQRAMEAVIQGITGGLSTGISGMVGNTIGGSNPANAMYTMGAGFSGAEAMQREQNLNYATQSDLFRGAENERIEKAWARDDYLWRRNLEAEKELIRLRGTEQRRGIATSAFLAPTFTQPGMTGSTPHYSETATGSGATQTLDKTLQWTFGDLWDGAKQALTGNPMIPIPYRRN